MLLATACYTLLRFLAVVSFVGPQYHNPFEYLWVLLLRWISMGTALLGPGEVRGYECREVSGLNLQWSANTNAGTIGRPKSSHIPSQAFVAAHPSKHRRAVTPLNSPGTTPIPVTVVPPACSVGPLSTLGFTSWTVFTFQRPGSKKKKQWLPVTFSWTNIEYPP